MTERIITVLTGDIQTGKTTLLQQLCGSRHDVYGILSPVVNGRRQFEDVHSKKQFRMEAEPGEAKLMVGRYVFSQAAFARAASVLRKALKEKNGFLLVDEIGRLELRGEGFNEVLLEIFTAVTTLKVVLIIRTDLLETAIAHYHLRDYFTVNVYETDNFRLS